MHENSAPVSISEGNSPLLNLTLTQGEASSLRPPTPRPRLAFNPRWLPCRQALPRFPPGQLPANIQIPRLATPTILVAPTAWRNTYRRGKITVRTAPPRPSVFLFESPSFPLHVLPRPSTAGTGLGVANTRHGQTRGMGKHVGIQIHQDSINSLSFGS